MTNKLGHLVSIAALLAGFSFFIAPAPAVAQTADELASKCRWVRNAKLDEGKIEIPADFGSGECWGFFRALQALSGYYDANQKPLLHICAPESATAAQYINIFVSYVDRNPAEGHMDGAMVATNALVKAFPCQRK